MEKAIRILKQLAPKITDADIEKLEKLAWDLGEIFDSFNREVCSSCPKERTVFREKTGKGCCNGCGNGWFYTNKAKEKQLRILKTAYKATSEHGFFSIKDKCCKLPRILKSDRCLEFCCVSFLRTQAGKITYKMSKIKRKYGIIF